MRWLLHGSKARMAGTRLTSLREQERSTEISITSGLYSAGGSIRSIPPFPHGLFYPLKIS